MVRHNRKDPGKTPFTNSQDISLGDRKIPFLVPGKAGQLLQQMQQPKMWLDFTLGTTLCNAMQEKRASQEFIEQAEHTS